MFDSTISLPDDCFNCPERVREAFDLKRQLIATLQPQLSCLFESALSLSPNSFGSEEEETTEASKPIDDAKTDQV